MGSEVLYLQRLRTAGKIVEASKTRPADTTTYASGDIVNESTSAGTIMTFTDVARENGRGASILGAELVDSAAATVKPEFELYLFDTSITVQNDNAAWAPSDADMEKCVGVIDFPSVSFKTGSGNGVVPREGLGMYVICAAASKNLYGILVARNAYVPASGEKFLVRLKIVQD